MIARVNTPLYKLLINNTLQTKEQTIKNEIKKSLEYLLNTRKPQLIWPEHLVELNSSILNYGLPDLTTIYHGTPASAKSLCQLIAKTIETHEPRLKNLSVTLAEEENLQPMLKLRIEAILTTMNIPSLFIFESSVDALNYHFNVY